MTYNRTLHGRFVSGRYTPIILVVMSSLLMLSAIWFPDLVASEILQPSEPPFLGSAVSRILSAVLFALAAFVISRQTFFDKRVHWKGALYMWLVAISLFANGNIVIAFVSLLYVLSVALLFAAQHSVAQVGQLFTSFMLLGVLALVTPFLLYLIPLYITFIFLANIFSVRNIAASILGLATPFWLVMGSAYVFPQAEVLSRAFTDGLPCLFEFSAPEYSTSSLLVLVLVILLLFPAAVLFMGSASPSKPLLRRRFSYIIVTSIYLLLLSCFVAGGSALFYFLMLPGLAVTASYIFSMKVTRMSNIFFIIVNVIMLAIATHILWLKH